MKKRAVSAKHATKIDIDTSQKSVVEMNSLIHDKVVYVQKIIQNTVLSINQYKKYEIFSNSDVILCISSLTDLYDKCKNILQKLANMPSIRVDQITAPSATQSSVYNEMNVLIEQLQQIVERLAIIVCGFGTLNLDDLFFISFGSELTGKKWSEPIWDDKYQLLLKYLHPIGYKTHYWKNKSKPKDLVVTPPTSASTILYCSNKITDTTITLETANQFECFDIDQSAKSVYVKIYGLRLVVHSEKKQKTLVINCLVDNIVLDCVTNAYIDYQKYMALNQTDPTTDIDIMRRMVDAFTLKDMLIYGYGDVLKKYNSVMVEVNYIKNTKLDVIIKKFLDMDVVSQRDMLIHLLMYNKEDDIQYITYLLYNLITTPNVSLSNNGGMSGSSAISPMDSAEQMLIYESFPWRIKLYFKDTMKNTIKYTKDMIHKYDVNRVSIEQQIYVMKAPENVKEKAILKLKEIKGKPDDSGNKAKQYLEGLLKIPFGVFREEPILKKIPAINAGFMEWIDKLPASIKSTIPNKKKYSTFEILQIIQRVTVFLATQMPDEYTAVLKQMNVKQINNAVAWVNGVYKTLGLSSHIPSTKSKDEKIGAIQEFVSEFRADMQSMAGLYDSSVDGSGLVRTIRSMEQSKTNILNIKHSLNEVGEILDASIHGHTHAKDQIMKIVGQWMNGEQSGYCFGFEGSPGIGKTSLAKKGLAQCLRDGDSTRPFAFIALGGSCNGSTLEGHSYTYVNSTWGRIVDILMDTKCMNPIIYIDELDKVSKTEHGKEIIGILTHLIDTTQNDVFQDKYFSGIDIDLSKALFIFSYNDPTQIDRILLDRIHRIKFDNLSLDDKIVIVRKYILPEINRKMGFDTIVELTDDTIEYLITTYTFESGVRKLKEVLFDLFGEINIELLKCHEVDAISLPIVLTPESIETKYLKKYDAITDKKIHDFDEVGVINGLWASMYGKGGVIPIQTMFYPSNSFLELKLTGMQGDVMKESMNVAKSLAWQLLEEHEQEALVKQFEKTKCQGLHIHCPDGAVSKDGPSAGTAITLAILSLFMNKSICYDVAITGEITLQGNVTEIGGLEDKIIGGIKAGVKTFLYPSRNKKEFDKFWGKYQNKNVVKGIAFHPVDTIHDTFPHIFKSGGGAPNEFPPLLGADRPQSLRPNGATGNATTSH